MTSKNVVFISHQADDDDEAVTTIQGILAREGYANVEVHFGHLEDILEPIQLCAEDTDPEIRSDALAAFRSAAGFDYERLVGIACASREVIEDFHMPTSIPVRLVVDSNGTVHNMTRMHAA